MTLLQLTLDFNQAAQRENLPGATSGINDVIASILSAVFVVAALLVLLYLIWAAIEWISAGGDSGKIQKARDKIVQSIIGIIVLASSLAIFGLLQYILGIEILTFTPSRSSTGPGRPTESVNSGPGGAASRGSFGDWLRSVSGGEVNSVPANSNTTGPLRDSNKQ